MLGARAAPQTADTDLCWVRSSVHQPQACSPLTSPWPWKHHALQRCGFGTETAQAESQTGCEGARDARGKTGRTASRTARRDGGARGDRARPECRLEPSRAPQKEGGVRLIWHSGGGGPAGVPGSGCERGPGTASAAGECTRPIVHVVGWGVEGAAGGGAGLASWLWGVPRMAEGGVRCPLQAREDAAGSAGRARLQGPWASAKENVEGPDGAGSVALAPLMECRHGRERDTVKGMAGNGTGPGVCRTARGPPVARHRPRAARSAGKGHEKECGRAARAQRGGIPPDSGGTPKHGRTKSRSTDMRGCRWPGCSARVPQALGRQALPPCGGPRCQQIQELGTVPCPWLRHRESPKACLLNRGESVLGVLSFGGRAVFQMGAPLALSPRAPCAHAAEGWCGVGRRFRGLCGAGSGAGQDGAPKRRPRPP